MPPEQQNQYASYVSQPTGQDNGGQKKLLIIVIGSVLLFVVLLAALFLGGPKKLTVNVKSDSSSEITYRFANQANTNDVKEIKDSSKSVEVSLPAGTYELTVQQDDTNYFSVIDTSEDSTIEATPQPERGRRYVGNLPGSCRFLLSNILYSHECGGALETMQAHVPATSTQPTFTRPSFNETEDVIEGTIKTKEGTILLVYEAVVADHGHITELGNGESPHIAHVLKSGSNMLGTGNALKGLPADERYFIQPYREGFLAYSASFSRAFYYASTKANPEEVAIAELENEDLSPNLLSAKDSSFVVAYAQEDEEDSGLSSSLVLHENNQTKTFEMDKTFESIHLCGNNKLCGLSAGTMYVYDVAGEDAKLQYFVNGVRSMASYGNGLVVSRDGGVISLDIEKRSGYVQYTYDDFVSCGLQPAGNTYMVCIEGDEGAESMLLIEQAKTSDSIDKKIASLMDMQELSVVSIYGNFITITPHAGGIKYQPATDTFGYDPEKVRQSKSAIEDRIKTIGLDKSKYKVRYTIN